MSENEMNEQPAGDQPAPTGSGDPAANPEPQGWRPPSDQAAPAERPASPWAPATSTPGSASDAPASSAAPSAVTPVSATPAVPPSAAVPPDAATAPAAAAPAEASTAQYPAAAPQSPYAAPADYTAAPGYTAAPADYTTPGGYPAAAYPAGEYPTAGYPVTGQPGDGTAPTYPSAGYPTSSYPATGTNDGRGRRGVGTIALLSVLGLALAAGGGVAGAATMHHFDKSNTVTVTKAGVVVDNAPIVDRSSLASIASAVSPSVVSITTSNAEGSGVILSTDGYILTNNHVAVTASGQSVQITFSDGSSAKATLVGTDAKTDLAVFKAENVSNLTAAKFGDSSSLQVGDTVLAIGSPLGLDGSVTAGIVSALNRTINETADTSPQNPLDPSQQPQSTTASPTIAGAIQTDAAINPGNSGGALVNTNGQVVGINTAIATNGADGNIGVGFAIPGNRAKQVADDLIKGVKVSHPQLGVEVSTADSNGGAQVQSVSSGSAAASAGIKSGDVITAFNGTAIHTSDDLLDDIQMGTVGTSYSLTVVRGGQTMTLNVTLQESK